MNKKISSPESLKNLLLRLFGDTNISNHTEKSEKEWRNTFLKILKELDSYLKENIETDELHTLMIHSGLFSAHMHIEENENFDQALLGYIEGIIRFSLSILGDLPNHSKRKGGRKKADHYELNRLRKLHYSQSSSQKYYTLILAYKGGFGLGTNPETAMMNFRNQYGYKKDYNDFLKWYRKNYPSDYAKVF